MAFMFGALMHPVRTRSSVQLIAGLATPRGRGGGGEDGGDKSWTKLQCGGLS